MVTVIRSILAGCILLFVAVPGYGQLNAVPEKAALKSIEKKKWDKAYSQLQKNLGKDSTNALALYITSLYFFAPDNPSYNLDSAYFYSVKSLSLFSLSSSRVRDRMRKLAVDSSRLVQLREQVDSATFEAVRKVNTEEAYIGFIRQHPDAAQVKEAAELRNDVAYLKALAANTYEDFQAFITRYPQAKQVEQARRNYERLLFEYKTQDKRLSSFQLFLKEYPGTPFRAQVERDIFQLYTLSGEPDRFLSYLQTYPNTAQTRQARNILFHLLRDSDAGDNVGIILSDSLERIRELNETYLVPFLKNEFFGFMDQQGKEVIRPSIRVLNDEYKCGAITEDFIVADNRILARDGSTVFAGKIDGADDLGSGFLKVDVDGCVRIIHKSGFRIDTCVQDVKILGNRFIAVQKKKGWTLLSLAGRTILPEASDNLDLIHQVLVVTKGKKNFLLTINELMDMADKQKFSFDYEVSSVKALHEKVLLVNAKDRDVVITPAFEVVVPASKQIKPTFFGYIAQTDSAWVLYNRKTKATAAFSGVEVNEPWIFAKTKKENFIVDPSTFHIRSRGYDSLRLKGAFALGKNGDTLDIHLKDSIVIRYTRPASTTFLPGRDSISFLLVESEGKKSIYDNRGTRYFTERSSYFEKIQYTGDGLFVVARKDKKGLVNAKGQLLVPVEYDAVGSAPGGGASLLKNGRFGYYDAIQRTLIKPQYEKNVNRYNKNLLIAFKNGYYGFIDIQNKPVTKFEFQEILYWNDSLVWLKKHDLWTLTNVVDKTVIHSDVREISMIKDAADEKLAIVRQKDFYGVVSSARGVVIPVSFTDLVNIGPADEPLFFTEKHVSEASIFVVIYYDENGKFLRREVYEDAEDYERIYCTDN